MRLKIGDMVKFKTSGYEIADIRNANPPIIAEGMVNGEAYADYVPLWCERENREPTTVYVSLKNIIEE